jgi:hypothetical protein
MATSFSKPLYTNDAVGKRILQQRVQEYDPSAAQSLTTTFADVDGSDYVFTPVSSSSQILYRFSFHESVAASVDLSNSYQLMLDGVVETESIEQSFRETTNIFAHGRNHLEYVVASWGTSAGTLKMQAKEVAAAKLHANYDGTLVRATLTIIEYGTSPVLTNTSLSGKAILQQIITQTTISATDTLTTTYADITGSDHSFTPTSASSEILYEYTFQQCVGVVGEAPFGHYKLVIDGTDENNSRSNAYPSGANAEILVHFTFIKPSWGTSAKIMKVQGREHAASFDTRLHENYYWDGAAVGSIWRDPVLRITEYE